MQTLFHIINTLFFIFTTALYYTARKKNNFFSLIKILRHRESKHLAKVTQLINDEQSYKLKSLTLIKHCNKFTDIFYNDLLSSCMKHYPQHVRGIFFFFKMNINSCCEWIWFIVYPEAKKKKFKSNLFNDTLRHCPFHGNPVLHKGWEGARVEGLQLCRSPWHRASHTRGEWERYGLEVVSSRGSALPSQPGSQVGSWPSFEESLEKI